MHFALLEGGVFLVLGTITAASTFLSVLGDGDVSIIEVVHLSAVGEKATSSYVTCGLTLLLNHSFLVTGLPQRYQDSVKLIQPGIPLFLYNYTTRSMHGVYEVSA